MLKPTTKKVNTRRDPLASASKKVLRRRARYAAKIKEAAEAIKAGAAKHVCISPKNDKMGPVPSVSLAPLATCPFRALGTCGEYCYACGTADNGCRRGVLESWARNTAIYALDPEAYWMQVRAAIIGSRFFRFHVAGDIPTPAYAAELFKTAEAYPATDMLIFTKQYEYCNTEIEKRGGTWPKNLKLLYSAGPGLDVVNPYNVPLAVFVPAGEETPDGVKECGGNCFNCFCAGVGCWMLEPGDAVALHEHGNGHPRKR